jgi:molecular chaperone DnaK (HSP70)
MFVEVFDVKRMIGRKFDDKNVQEDLMHWPFKVLDDGRNQPVIEVQYMGKTTRFMPEEISAKVLFKMKQIAEAYLSQDVIDAVITVPVVITYPYLQRFIFKILLLNGQCDLK